MDDPRPVKRKKLSCPRDGCPYMADDASLMKLHELRHKGIRPFSCYVDGCPYKAYTASALKIHEMTHTGEKPHVCDIGQCRQAFTQTSALNRHKRMLHPGGIRVLVPPTKKTRRLLACDVGGCPYTTRRPDHMDLHEKRHRGEKTFSCDTCPYMAVTKNELTVHQSTHLDVKPFVCDFEGCEYSCSQSGNLIIHKKTHTIEGQIRRKKQEHRLNKLLKEWGYTVDCESTINAKAGQCLTDTQRHFSRLDFRIVNCTNAICIVECDEDQHYWYNLSCEMSRMADVRAALAIAGYTLPVYWIRYAPTGKYHVGSEQVKMPRKQREEGLKEHLAKVCSPDFTPTQVESMHYMSYDLQSTGEGPEIPRDPDF
ncbi:unnamed protein product, partial [Ectocarpus sp. 8 AP-2014]